MLAEPCAKRFSGCMAQGKQSQAGISEFKASLVYLVSCRPGYIVRFLPQKCISKSGHNFTYASSPVNLKPDSNPKARSRE